jgi:DNA-directed RNA polymerase subunit RPC12/RpoP
VSDRKYRQRGYQDDGRERGPRPGLPSQRPEREPGAPAGARRISSEGAKNPRMMGYREVARCARCGTIVDAQILSLSACPKCQQQLRSCVQCTNFDPSARFECARPIPARLSPKDAANECTLFEARTSWERETTAAAPQPAAGSSQPSSASSSSARKAFDDLFKI